MLYGIMGSLAVGLGLATWKAPRLTSVIVWALLAAIFTSSAILMTFPGAFAEKALWVALSVPFIWVALQFWTYWDRKAWRVAIGLMALTALSAAIVFTSEPMI